MAQEPKLGKLGGGTPSQKKMTRHEKRALSAVKNWLYNRQSYTARRQNGVIPLCLCTIFIALPACVGYLSNCPKEGLLVLCLISFVCQAIGVFFGAGQAGRINVRVLKKGVAVFSIAIAVYMIIGLI